MSISERSDQAEGHRRNLARWRRWVPWAAIVVVVATLLGFGLHQGSANSSLDARVNHIAGLVRCPVCNGETVAQSQATPAVEIRNQIRADLQSAESESQILSGLVGEYGPSILEKPPATGAGLIVWILPVAAASVAVVGLVLVLRRWRRRGDSDMSDEIAIAQPSGFEGDPDFAGDRPVEVDNVGSTGVEHGEVSNLSAAPAGIGNRSDTRTGNGAVVGVSRRPASMKKRAVAGAGGVLVVGGVVWALAAFTGTRLPGQEISGKTLSAPQVSADLLAANADESKGNVVAAVGEYQKVLSVDQSNVEALSGEGWLLAQTGQPTLLDKGLAMLVNAEKVNPVYGPAHVYRGIALLGEGDYTDAIPELEWYLAHQPAPSLKAEVAQALAKAKAEQAAAAGG